MLVCVSVMDVVCGCDLLKQMSEIIYFFTERTSVWVIFSKKLLYIFFACLM